MTDDTPRIYLIDGTAQVYRAFYAVRDLSTSEGVPTNAVFGFIRMLSKLIQDESPRYLGVSFDLPGPTFRHEIFEAYKAHRPETPEDLIQQIPKVKEFLKCMHIPIYELQGFEADDLLATLAKKAEADGMETVIVSSDKDLLQLVSDKIVTLSERMGHKVLYTPEKVKEKYGIEPAQIQDFLGLVGDSSDNIPGIKGIGPKTAAKLLQDFGSLEDLVEHPEALKRKKQQASLRTGKEIALQSKLLATVRTDVPIELNLGELERKEPDYRALKDYFRELEFYAFLRDMIPDEALSYGSLAEVDAADAGPDISYITVLTEEELATLIAELNTSGGFAVDTETSSQYPMRAELVGISAAFTPHQAFYIPVGHRYIGAPQQLALDRVIHAFKPLLEDPSLPKYGQNIKYDAIVLAHYGIQLKGIAFDSMIASYVLNPSKRSHKMDYLAEEFLNHRCISYVELVGKGAKQSTIDMIPVDCVTDYAAEDADITLQLTQALKPKIEEQQLHALYNDIELPMIDVLATMEQHGVSVDSARLQQLSSEFARKMEAIKKEIFDLAGQEFNINSPKQLGPILFDTFGMPRGRKTKTGYSTDVDVLTDLARAGYELPDKILAYRQLSKLKSTYSDALPKQIDPKTGRIHCSYNQTVTATGRLSSSDPNLQNIPIKSEDGRRIRQAFIPEKGKVLLSADYSQIELRILAHVTGDTELVKAYRENLDIHSNTASKIFGLPAEEITATMRREAKTVNFSVIYGISAFSLSKDLNIPRSEAQRYIDEYFALYQGVQEFINATIDEAKTTGYVKTLLDRIRYIPEIHSKNSNVRRFGERTAVNTRIQGTAADMIKLAMISIHRQLPTTYPDVKMIMQVHDELVFDVPEAQADDFRDFAVREMESVLDLKVPIKVEAHYGSNWDEAH
ncbi:DNA polymerase I [candidate division KSB3 bacterium]|uniref:DNA polymerase I n=1 Tax=candidate division KSB3 bacterium TaxID=2044937 RepID=A0A2G6EE95_9BACT|nr:MAG: DNA polymerase I [candidate division KSB3 bacterium]PIE28379.1 MAG: DNA polymerase I [candidate division KSB3 bacterium]